VATYRSADTAGPLEYETMLTRLREARYVFAGPGSPSYALRQWRSSLVPGILATKLKSGGVVVFASAAAVTLGCVSLPVYEIYKVGDDPHWLDGLDLLGEAGLNATVIPHYNNTEGGNHDTRFCYMGERRLSLLERSLPKDAFVLGVDEHTACILDLDAKTATVTGNGSVTLRRMGASTLVPAGATLTLNQLREGAESSGAVSTVGTTPPRAREGSPEPACSTGSFDGSPGGSPFLGDAHRIESEFASALEASAASDAIAAVLELDQLLLDWSRDTLQSDEMDTARSMLRSMIVRLGEVAESGLADPRSTVGPFVESLLDLRAALREERNFGLADRIREQLTQAGVQVQDSPKGTTWHLRGTSPER
jgi:hypothetical protein